MHGEQGSEWGEDERQSEWADGVQAATNSDGLRPGRRKLRKPVVIPRRAAPPPPPLGLGASPPSATSAGLPSSRTFDSPSAGPSTASASSSGHAQADSPQSQYSVLPPTTRAPYPTASPVMIPMQAEDGPSRPAHGPHMSMQSMSYSIYDIGQDSSSRASTPTASSSTPRGTYTKVPASRLEHDDQASPRTADRVEGAHPADRIEDHPRRGQNTRARTVSDEPKTPEEMVDLGLEARALGDLAKSAYYFWKAAEMGSMAGRLYWGT